MTIYFISVPNDHTVPLTHRKIDGKVAENKQSKTNHTATLGFTLLFNVLDVLSSCSMVDGMSVRVL